MLGQRPARMRAHLHDKHIADGKFRAEAEQQRRDAARIGFGQLGEIAGAHHDLGLRQEPARLDIARQRGGKAEMNGIEDRIDDERDVGRRRRFRRADERSEIAMRFRDQNRRNGKFLRNVQSLFGEAQEIVGAGGSAAFEFGPVGRIDADLMPRRFQRAHALFKMRERRIGQAAEIDDFGALAAHVFGAGQNGLDGQRRGIDDLAENAQVVAREIGRAAAASEKGREIDQFIRPAHEGHADFPRQTVEVGAASARQDDPIGLERPRQPSQNDRLRHQRRDLDADVEHRPSERARRRGPASA